jgi:hypothetical protein
LKKPLRPLRLMDFDFFNSPRLIRLLSSRPGEDRTLDPMIKSHVLYQLSYGP